MPTTGDTERLRAALMVLRRAAVVPALLLLLCGRAGAT
jgi:hypothetical protein